MMGEGLVENSTELSSSFVIMNPVDEDAAVESTEDAEERFFRIPIVRMRDDENGGHRLEESEGVECMSESFIRQRYGVDPHHLREFRVSGNAMRDTIRAGDRLLVEVDGCESLVDGEICLVSSPTGVLVRRMGLRGDAIVLLADNSSVPDQEVQHDQWREKYKLLARVLEVVRPI